MFGLIDWMYLFKVCSQRIKKNFLGFFGSDEAGVSFGVGAGGDVMKKIDLEAERTLIDTLLEFNASCTLISEEIGIKKIGSHPSSFYITVDPVDGTTNAIRGLYFMATSIAGSEKPYIQDVDVALVADLFHDVTYTAKKGLGAFRNGEKITPSSTFTMEEAVFGVALKGSDITKLADSLSSVLRKVGHVRHLGANALEICYVADGTIDAFIDVLGKLRVTDVAAAYLILREAGGLIVTHKGANIDAQLAPTQRVSFVAAANESIYNKIVEQLT